MLLLPFCLLCLSLRLFLILPVVTSITPGMRLSDLEICSRPSASLFAEHAPELPVQKVCEGAKGLGFRVWNSGFRVWEVNVQASGFRICSSFVDAWNLALAFGG